MPTLSLLRDGAILGSMAHAVMQTADPWMYQEWIGNDYRVSDGSGADGVVTFFKDGVVGACWDAHSNHTRDYLINHQESFFRSMPGDYRAIADKITLQYLLMDWLCKEWNAPIKPMATAVFWNQGNELVAAVPWEEMLDNGGHILRIQFMETASALAAWEEEYGFASAHVEFVGRLFRRWQEKSWGIELTQAEAKWLQDKAVSPEAMTACRMSFARMGIVVPCVC